VQPISCEFCHLARQRSTAIDGVGKARHARLSSSTMTRRALRKNAMCVSPLFSRRFLQFSKRGVLHCAQARCEWNTARRQFNVEKRLKKSFDFF